jgi:hypothetical protein
MQEGKASYPVSETIFGRNRLLDFNDQLRRPGVFPIGNNLGPGRDIRDR